MFLSNKKELNQVHATHLLSKEMRQRVLQLELVLLLKRFIISWMSYDIINRKPRGRARARAQQKQQLRLHARRSLPSSYLNTKIIHFRIIYFFAAAFF